MQFYKVFASHRIASLHSIWDRIDHTFLSATTERATKKYCRFKMNLKFIIAVGVFLQASPADGITSTVILAVWEAGVRRNLFVVD